MKKIWTRTCQECGHKLEYPREPLNKGTENYDNRKCKKCKSPAYDWGSFKLIPENEDDRLELES